MDEEIAELEEKLWALRVARQKLTEEMKKVAEELVRLSSYEVLCSCQLALV